MWFHPRDDIYHPTKSHAIYQSESKRVCSFFWRPNRGVIEELETVIYDLFPIQLLIDKSA